MVTNMAYINKREFQKLVDYAPKGVDKRTVQSALIARGHTIQGINDQEQKTFGGQLLKDLASPFVKGANLMATAAPVLYETARALPAALGIGDKDKARERLIQAGIKADDKQRQQISTALGNYNPITSVKEAAGTALEGFSTFYGGGAAKSVAQAGFKGAIKSAATQGVKAGAIGGAGFGLGRGLGDDQSYGESLQQGVIGGAVGAVGGGVLGGAIFGGSLATKAIRNKISQKLQPVNQQVEERVSNYISKAIKPSTAGRSANQLQNIQRKQVEGFQILKNNVKDIKLPDEYGGLTSRLPKTVQEVVSALQDVKTKLFSRYDKLARQAGDKGADFNPIKTIGELKNYANDKSHSLALRKYASDVLEEIAELKGESPLVIQSRIKELNESLAGYFAGRVEKGRARIDASVAKLLNEELDDVIFNFTAGDYKGLRSQFSALKSIEKDATRAAQRMLNRQNKGLIDFTDIFTGGDLMSGVLTMNPAQISRGVVSRGIKEAYKYLNSPDRYIRKIFEELSELPVEQRLINRGLPNPSGKVSGAIPLSTPLKPKPLPKGKGEILKTSSQSTPLVSKTEQSFIKEAKKYKSAEEFIKAQDIKPNIVYHGTNKEFSKFNSSADKVTGRLLGDGTYFTKNISGAEAYAKGNKGNIILRADISDKKIFDFTKDAYKIDSSGKIQFTIPKDILNIAKKYGINSSEELVKLSDAFSGNKNLVNKIIKESGYDGVSTGSNILIFNASDIKPIKYSQLTDIWNKANGKTKLK